MHIYTHTQIHKYTNVHQVTVISVIGMGIVFSAFIYHIVNRNNKLIKASGYVIIPYVNHLYY